MDASDSRPRGTFFLTLLTALVAGTACDSPDTSNPPSLTSPSAMEVVHREACGSQNAALASFSESGGCDIGLVADANTDRLAIADIGRTSPSLADLDPGTPGVNHLRVGERPMALAADPAATTAYTLNQTDASISVVDLWRVSRIRTIEIPEGPQTLDAVSGDGPNGVPWLVTTTRNPEQVTFRPGVRCYRSADDLPSGAPEVTSACAGRDIEVDQIPLAGRPSTATAGANDEFVYVGYHDRPFISVILPPERDDVLARQGVSCRGARTSAPCEVDRIGVTYGCSDGVDNDGDGAVDAEDLQCFGPNGAESPEGVGRAPQGPCSNGIDDDGDGDVDRADDDCLLPSGSEDTFPTGADAQTVCSNGEDDDGDGVVDQQDPDCYGRFGQREDAVEVSGIDDIEVGASGNFAYAVDRANDQVLTIDVRRHRLIDAAAAVEPERTAFTDNLGIRVGASPLAVGPYVSRSLQWEDPNDSGHGIVSHSFGTYVTADNGSIYYLEAVRTSCEVDEPSGELLTDAEFNARGQRFMNSAERDCLQLPAMPIERDTDSEACQNARACRNCRGGTAPSSASCSEVCESYVSERRRCRTSGRLTEPSGNVRLTTNPRFERVESAGRTGGQPGRVLSGGQCTEPTAYLEAMRNYRQQNPESASSLDCRSRLRPQPLSADADLEGLLSFDDIPRADLLHRSELGFQPPGESGQNVQTSVQSVPYDVRLRNETLRVLWEGILPETRRNDGIVSADSDDVIQTGGLNACSAGIRAGDRLQILTSPRTGSDAPDDCGALTPGNNQSGREVRSWRIDSVRPDALTISTMSNDEDATDVLPPRGCYPDGLTFQVRAEDEFIVVGTTSGYLSTQRASHGLCVENRGASDERFGSRVSPGEWLRGPYYQFQLFDGPVPPVRSAETEYAFGIPVQRNFASSTFAGTLLLGTDVLFAEDVSGGAKLMATDFARNRIYLRNFRYSTDANEAEQFLR